MIISCHVCIKREKQVKPFETAVLFFFFFFSFFLQLFSWCHTLILIVSLVYFGAVSCTVDLPFRWPAYRQFSRNKDNRIQGCYLPRDKQNAHKFFVFLVAFHQCIHKRTRFNKNNKNLNEHITRIKWKNSGYTRSYVVLITIYIYIYKNIVLKLR